MRLWMMPLLMASLAVACDSSDVSDADADADADADSDTDTDTDTDSDTDTDVQCDRYDGAETNDAPLWGVVTDVNGCLIEFRAQMCNNSCIVGDIDDAGAFIFDWSLPLLPHSFEIVPIDGDHHWPEVLTPHTVQEFETRIDMVLPRFAELFTVPETSAEVAVGDDLHLTLGMDTIQLDFGKTEDQLAAVRVDPSIWPPLELPTPADAVVVYYLGPVLTRSDDGVGFRIPNSWGGTDGEDYDVWFSSYDDEAFLLASTVTMADGELVGGGIHMLSTLVVTIHVD